MKNISSLLLLGLFAFASCTEDEKPLNQFMKTDNLVSQFFEIDIHQDTIIKTGGGTTILIEKDAIKSKTGEGKVKLEVKEAYKIEDIVKAGLHTRSDDNLLSSGGMIYINANDAEIDKKLQISMASDNFQQEMQLFKGEPNADGSINWIDPQPIINSSIDSLNKGRQLYAGNCNSCHSITKDATGPPLAFIPQRRDKKWLKLFIQNSARLIADGDILANCIYNEWNKTAMTAFPHLTDGELELLYLYINEESRKLDPRDYPDLKVALDSCEKYAKAKNALNDELRRLIKDNQATEATKTKAGITIEAVDLPENIVVPKYEQATYYRFSITTFGWYNADAFILDLPGFEPAELKVKINNSLEDQYNIYLVIPDEKICADGGFLKGQKSWYGFYTDDDKLSLPLNRDAYILVFCEQDSKISFALHSFKTQRSNTIEINTAVISREEMQQKLSTLHFEGLSTEVKETKNAVKIRKINVDLQNVEQLKPVGADCSCGFNIDETGMTDSTQNYLNTNK